MDTEQEKITTQNSKRTFWISVASDPQNMAEILAVVALSLYFIWRMFYLTPSYEELHDYSYFICRGPLYVMTHWSDEGNHIGYNLVASIINYCGNPYIGLRGTACVCAVANLILIYRLAKRYFIKWIPFATMVIYMGFKMVNLENVQGRGYSISTTLFLLAVYMLARLTQTTRFDKKHYVRLTITFICAMYVLPWNILWVIPLCVAVLLYLVMNGARTQKVSGRGRKNIYYSQLTDIFICEVTAFVSTGFLYLITIMGSGAQILREEAVYDGSRLWIAFHDPVRTFLRGIGRIESSFGEQEIAGSTYPERWYSFVHGLCVDLAPGFGNALILVVILALVIMILGCVLHFEESRTCMRLILSCTLLWMPVMLLFISHIPANNVFMYMGVTVAMAVGTVVNFLMGRILDIKKRMRDKKALRHKEQEEKEHGSAYLAEKELIRHLEHHAEAHEHYAEKHPARGTKRKHHISEEYLSVTFYLPLVLAVTFFFIGVAGDDFLAPYDVRSDKIYEVLIMEAPTSYKTPVVTDDNQAMLMLFRYGRRASNDIAHADYLILDKKMFQKDYDDPETKKWYETYDTIPWEHVNHMKITYENDGFILYTK